MVRCKFACQEVTRKADGSATVKLTPVSTGSDENKAFYKYTPTGLIEFATINAAAADQFTPGKAYYIDLSEAPD